MWSFQIVGRSCWSSTHPNKFLSQCLLSFELFSCVFQVSWNWQCVLVYSLKKKSSYHWKLMGERSVVCVIITRKQKEPLGGQLWNFCEVKKLSKPKPRSFWIGMWLEFIFLEAFIHQRIHKAVLKIPPIFENCRGQMKLNFKEIASSSFLTFMEHYFCKKDSKPKSLWPGWRYFSNIKGAFYV